MATYVLVHGAWHGGWCWRDVRRRLQAEGHEVFTPTLTGLGERSHLLSPDVRLQTHVDDVLNLIRWEGLHEVVLCGHSYAGVVVTGVAEAVPERIRTLVYLDACLPASGQSFHDAFPTQISEAERERARTDGDGWRVAPPPAADYAVRDADVAAWVDRQCTPQPLATFEDPIRYSDRATSIADTRFISAAGLPAGWPYFEFADMARQRGWAVASIDTMHDVMLDDPAGLAELLHHRRDRAIR